MRKIIYLCFLSIALLSVSCDREDSFIEESDGASKIEEKKPEGDMLYFNSSDNLKEYISGLLETDTDLLEVAEMDAREKKHVSLLYLYGLNLAELDSMKIDRHKIAIVNSYDNLLHLLLDRKGEIGIGEYIYRINGDFVFRYTLGNATDIDRFMTDYRSGRIKIKKGETIDYNSNLSVYMHENNESIEADLSDTILYREGKNTTETKNNEKVNTYFSSGKTRMVARHHISNWWFYTSIGASTKTQIKKWYWFFGWHSYWRTKRAYNRFNYDVTYTISGSFMGGTYVGHASGHKYCYCRCAYKIFAWNVNLGKVYRRKSHGKTHHWSHWFSENPSVVSRTLYF